MLDSFFQMEEHLPKLTRDSVQKFMTYSDKMIDEGLANPLVELRVKQILVPSDLFTPLVNTIGSNYRGFTILPTDTFRMGIKILF